MSRRLKIFAALTALALALPIAATLVRARILAPLTIPTEGMVLEVREGSSLTRVATTLKQQGALPSARLFRIVGRMTGADQRIRRGEYRLSAGQSMLDVLDQLQSGATIRYLVTLPEGIRLADALALLRSTEGIQPVLAGIDDPRLDDFTGEAPSAEGLFLPETYQYERDDTDLDILRQAHKLFEITLAEVWEQRDLGLPYDSPYEALIMASIIEKETGVAEERAQIAGVFVRRLRRDMRLQTDPTVIYGLGDGFDGNLTRAHLRDENNEYNSYRRDGLPPTPIALAGRAALEAAVRPAAGDDLYFVARGDGTHEFNATLAGHEDAVRRYQLQRRENYRSTVEREK
ncbi:MAG: endolytic transglycosylase MltG [Pseudomonadota bacterium]